MKTDEIRYRAEYRPAIEDESYRRPAYLAIDKVQVVSVAPKTVQLAHWERGGRLGPPRWGKPLRVDLAKAERQWDSLSEEDAIAQLYEREERYVENARRDLAERLAELAELKTHVDRGGIVLRPEPEEES